MKPWTNHNMDNICSSFTLQVRAQNTIEIIGIVAFNFCCFAYSIFEISQIKSSLCINPEAGGSVCKFIFFAPGRAQDLLTSITPFLIVVVVVIGVTQCLVTWLAYQLFQEFGWKIYKKIGADPNMKSKQPRHLYTSCIYASKQPSNQATTHSLFLG